MNLPPFPDDHIPTSPEARRRLIAWGEECARGELEELRRDAERYRWLKENAEVKSAGGGIFYYAMMVNKTFPPSANGKWGSDHADLDAAIDAARADGG